MEIIKNHFRTLLSSSITPQTSVQTLWQPINRIDRSLPDCSYGTQTSQRGTLPGISVFLPGREVCVIQTHLGTRVPFDRKHRLRYSADRFRHFRTYLPTRCYIGSKAREQCLYVATDRCRIERRGKWRRGGRWISFSSRKKVIYAVTILFAE